MVRFNKFSILFILIYVELCILLLQYFRFCKMQRDSVEQLMSDTGYTISQPYLSKYWLILLLLIKYLLFYKISERNKSFFLFTFFSHLALYSQQKMRHLPNHNNSSMAFKRKLKAIACQKRGNLQLTIVKLLIGNCVKVSLFEKIKFQIESGFIKVQISKLFIYQIVFSGR